MCGIAGVLVAPGRRSADELGTIAQLMASTLRHRGPDDADVWVDPAASMAMGFQRLAIVDLTDHGRQPMRSRCGRYVLVFNGEIYNFRPLRAELERAGRRFRGDSDTEVLLAAIESWGIDRALRRADGMFALAVWDEPERTLTLARDRMGEKPLYFGTVGGMFTFGSELKALRAHPDFDAPVSTESLALYLEHGWVPAPRSIYEDIHQLRPGTMVRVRLDRSAVRTEEQQFWSLLEVAEAGSRDPFRGSRRDAEELLAVELERAVGSRLYSDVPLGAFLSGGVDSSAVVAMMSQAATGVVRTFTIGFGERSFDEARHASAVARHLGTEHHELYVSPADALELVPSLAQIYDEPFADPSQLPTTLLARLTREHVTVALSGDGGDELFAGYAHQRWAHRYWRPVARLPLGMRRTLAGVLTRVPVPSGATAADFVGLDGPAALHHRLTAHWKDPAALVHHALAPTALHDFRARPLPRGVGTTGIQLYLDQVAHLPDDILVKVDRAAMAASLETRLPFLSPAVVALSWRLPLRWQAGGEGKQLLRRVLARHLPTALFERPKHGFDVPLAVWLRGPLREWAEGLLDPKRLRDEGFFRPAMIQSAWKAHLAGTRDASLYLWDILMFQAWREHTGAVVGPSRAA